MGDSVRLGSPIARAGRLGAHLIAVQAIGLHAFGTANDRRNQVETSQRAISRDTLLRMVTDVMRSQGKPPPTADADGLAELGFSSLDLAELTVRLEDLAGNELAVEAAEIRPLGTVGDLLDMLMSLVK